MRLAVAVFKGVMPRFAARLLPDGYGQNATNARLLDGNLRAWRKPKSVAALPGHGDKEPSLALYKMVTPNAGADVFLRWPTDVSVARGPIAGDVTERLYFTGALDDPAAALDSAARPKVTNFAKAVMGAAHAGVDADEYPHDWLILGVPAPAAAPAADSTPVTETTVYSDGSDTAVWTGAGISVDNVTIPGIAPSIRMTGASNMHADLGVGFDDLDALVFDFQYNADKQSLDIRFACDAAGNGPVIRLDTGFTSHPSPGTTVIHPGTFRKGTAATWTGAPALNSAINALIPTNAKNNRFRATITIASDGVTHKATINVAIYNATTGSFISTGSQTFPFSPEGTYAGFRNFAGSSAWIDEVSYGTTTATDDPGSPVAAYVYTWINEFGEEGPPSPASNEVRKSAGFDTLITGIADPDAGQVAEYGLAGGLAIKRLYRAVTGATETIYRKVADIAYGVTEYGDHVDDTDLGVDLESTNWDLPPTDGHSILALPNGITLMASKNQVCPSVTNRPHAYPVDYRLATDFTVIGLGAIDTTVFVLTQANPYIVIGSDPAVLSMAKIGVAYGCVSRRSIAYLKGFGVVYASPDGLVSLSGASGPVLLTDGYFTREQWQLLNPASIDAESHDDRYHFWWKNGDAYGGFIFDPKPGGMGLVPISLDAVYGDVPANPTAMYSDPLTDTLYLARNVGGADDEVTRWDPADDTAHPALPFVWRSKVWQMPYPMNFGAAQLKGQEITGDDDTVTLEFRYYVDGELVFVKRNPGNEEFVLPSVTGTSFEIELASVDADAFPVVEMVQIAEGMEELL